MGTTMKYRVKTMLYHNNGGSILHEWSWMVGEVFDTEIAAEQAITFHLLQAKPLPKHKIVRYVVEPFEPYVL